MKPQKTASAARPWAFLLTVLLFSLPLYMLNGIEVSLPLGLPPSVVMIVVPMLVAVYLTYRSNHLSGVRDMLASVADVRKIDSSFAIVFAILIVPFIMLVSYMLGVSLGVAKDGSFNTNILTILLMFAAFFIGAIPEELGWTTYATRPLQKRYGIFIAGIIIGLVWQLWHLIPFLQLGRDPWWIIFHFLTGIGLRVLMGYLFAWTNSATFPALIIHAMVNTFPEILPGGYASYVPALSAIVTWIVVIVVMYTSRISNGKYERQTAQSRPKWPTRNV